MARYKAIPSRNPKEEFDAWWDGVMTECGATPAQIEQTKRESAEFLQKSHDL